MIFICAVLIAGIVINLAGNTFSRAIGTPLYLDTIGSMLASLLGGYVPGMFVAFCTNLFMSIKDSSQMAYGFLNMIIAMLTCFFLRKGFFDKIYKVILLIPFYTLIASTTSAVLSWLLEDADHIEIPGNLRLEFFDKGIAILFVFVVWMLIPGQKMFSMTYSDMARNPWERFSAAAGMAVYGRDGTNYEEVFNCADGRMYANKVEMKKRLS